MYEIIGYYNNITREICERKTQRILSDKLTLLKNLLAEKCNDHSLKIPYTLTSNDVSSTRY